MCNPDSGHFADKRVVAGSATMGFDAADSHLIKQFMGSGSSLFGGRGRIFRKLKKVYESTSPTASRWLSRFMLGEKRIMVVVRSHDEALTVNKLLLIGDISEEDWSKSNSEE